MSYARKSDLIERFGERELVQLTDRAVPPKTVDEVVVERALGDATAMVDGYVGKGFSLPLAIVPKILVKVTADVARFYLHGKAADKDSPVTMAYVQAVSWLKDVSNGRVQLEAGGVAPVAAPGAAGRVSGSRPLMTRQSLAGF